MTRAHLSASSRAPSQAFLAKLRDDLLAENGVKPAQVKLVPLAANTATCEATNRRISWRLQISTCVPACCANKCLP